MGKLSALKNKVDDLLDMRQKARMERAREMGFDTDTTYYHGASDDIDAFRESTAGKAGRGGVYFTDSPEQASKYSELSARFGSNSGRGDTPNVTPSYLRMDNPYISERGMPYNENVDSLKNAGYDGVVLKGEMPDGGDEVIAFNPNQVRSVNAAFDPAKKDSSNLLAGIGGGAVVGASALGSEEADAGVFSKGTELAQDFASRMQRAKDMGFDTETTYYHGTNADFDEFNLGQKGSNSNFLGSEDVTRAGIFHAEDKGLAEEFAEQGGRSGKVMENLLRTHKTFDASGYGFSDLPDEFFEKNNLNPRYYQNLQPWETWQVFDDDAGGREFVDALKRDGYDSVKLMDVSSGDIENTTSIVTFDPANIRSVNAAFDPAKKDSSNLLAGIGAAGVGVSSMLGSNQADAMPTDTITAEEYPLLDKIGYHLSRFDTPIGKPFEGLGTYLQKLGEPVSDKQVMHYGLLGAGDFSLPAAVGGMFTNER